MKKSPTTAHENCLNCGTPLVGAYCYICGQEARDAEPSLHAFCIELVEMMTHADGKVIRTIRRLLFEPSQLTRDYIAGKRASEIRPLRMFFVSLLLLFAFVSVAPFHKTIAEGRKVEFVDTHAQHVHTESLEQSVQKLTFNGPRIVREWMHTHLVGAVTEPDEVQHVMGEWAERVVLLILPISTLILWSLYAFPRPIALYNHLIFSLHSLTVVFLLVTIASIIGHVLPANVSGWADRVLILAMMIHLFAHLRGFYCRSVGGTLLRMGLLGMTTGAASLLLLFLLALIGLQLGVEAAQQVS